MDDTQVLDCTQALPDDFDEDTEEGPAIVAWLEVNGRRYEIGRGETKIGRDPEACKITLESKALSKEHAVIEIDGDVHTLADLDSRNKTRIGRMILKPNVRYALQGGETVKFGDINAVYIKKPKSQEIDSGSETDSESMLQLETSEDRTLSPTLTHHLPGLDTPMPQRGEPVSDLSDIIPETPQAMRNIPGNRIVIPESPTLSQSTPRPKESGSATGSIHSPNMSLIKKLDEIAEDSFSFDPSQPASKASTNLKEEENKNVNTDLVNYNSDASTDIEDDDNPTQVFSPITKLSSCEEEPKLKPKNVDDEDEKGWSSDASTDIEDVFNQPTQPYPLSSTTPDNEKETARDGCNSPEDQSYEDCTQDIMAVFGLKGKIDPKGKRGVDSSKHTNKSKAQAPSSPVIGNKNNKDEEADLDAATQVFTGSEQEMVFRKPVATAPKPKRKSKGQLNDSLDIDFLDAPTQTFTSETDDSDTFNAPTQPFTNYVPKDNVLDESASDSLSDAPTQIFDKDSTKDDIFDAPTQPFCEGAAKYDISGAPTQPLVMPIQSNNEDTVKMNDSSSSKDGTTLDILDAPTQEFVPSHQNIGGEKSVPTVLVKSVVARALTETHSDSDDNIDLFTAPTQPFQPHTSVNDKTSNSLSEGKGSNKADLSDSDDDDDIFNQPTQAFSIGTKADVDLNAETQLLDTTVAHETGSNLTAAKPEVQGSDKADLCESDDDVDIFNQPTQAFSIGTKADVDLNAETQLLDTAVAHETSNSIAPSKPEGKDSSKAGLCDTDDDIDIFNQPNQAFSKGVKADVDLNAETQLLDTAVALETGNSLTPTKPVVKEREHAVSELSCVSYETVPRNSSDNKDPDADAPTQMMEDDLHNAPTQPFSEESKMGDSIHKSRQGLTKSLILLWGGLDSEPVQNMETQHTADSNSKTPITVKELENKAKCPETEYNDSASDTSETLLTESQLDDEYLGVLNKGVKEGCVLNTGESLHADTTNIEKEKREKNTEEENYNSDASTDMEDESPVTPKINTGRGKQTSESSSKNETSFQERSIDSGIGGQNLLSPRQPELTSDQENKENESSPITHAKTHSLSLSKTDQGFSTPGSVTNETEAAVEQALVENKVANKDCTEQDGTDSDAIKTDKQDADAHIIVDEAIDEDHSIKCSNESLSNVSLKSDVTNKSVASSSVQHGRRGRRRKAVNDDTVEQMSCSSPQLSSPRQTRPKRTSRRTSPNIKSSEGSAAENDARPELPRKDNAEINKLIQRDTRCKRGKRKTSVPVIEESAPVIKMEIKTENADEDLYLDHQIPDIQIKVEVKLEETDDQIKLPTDDQIELPTRSRRKSKVPNRYSPEKEVKKIRKRSQKSISVHVEQEPVQNVLVKRRRSTRGETSTVSAGTSTEKHVVPAQEKINQEPSADVRVVSNVEEIIKQESPTANVEGSHSITDSENEPAGDVKRRRSTRPKKSTSASQQTRSSKPRASTASAQARAPKRTRASRAAEDSDPPVTNRARLNTIEESLEHNADIKIGRKTQTKNKKYINSTEPVPGTSGVTVAQRRRASNKGVMEMSSDEQSEGLNQSSEESVVYSRARKRRTSGGSTEMDSSPSRSLRRGRSRKGSPPLADPLWSPSERQQRANNKPRVLFTGYKDTKDEKIVTDLGGFLVDSPQACSVLVTTRVCRTFKLLAVIGKGQPIVSPAWLTACKSARCFVDPWQYLIEDRSAEEEFGFNLEQSLCSASKVSLFEGLAIHATPSVKPAPIQMKEIIVCSGGRYLDQPPKKFGPQIMIVSCPDDRKHWADFKKLGIPILGTEFVLTGLLRHELLLDEFILS